MTAQELPFEDPVGAFCRANHVALKGAGEGPLEGLAFGTKDVFHIAGARTGFGSPVWLATHEPPTETASAVKRLLDAGADLAGKTHTDEMAYSLTGENVHYGTPVNARAPETHSRRLFQRLGGGRHRRPRGLCHRHRLRWLGPPPGELLRHLRHAPDRGSRAAGRSHSLRPAL